MKQTITLKHLFKLAGKDGDPLGVKPTSIYFDGRRAVAASWEATLAIDCPQQIPGPVIIPVDDLQSALAVSPELVLREQGGVIKANGVRVDAVSGMNDVPGRTMELIDLDRSRWEALVKPFRLDGSRLRQIHKAMASDTDPRVALRGLYLDFPSGAIVGSDGKRMHIVEEALPVPEAPAVAAAGEILPGSVVGLLAAAGGVQEVFVIRRRPMPAAVGARQDGATGPEGEHLICVSTGNGRLRARAVTADIYVSYRPIFEKHREYPASLVLDPEDMEGIMSVIRVAQRHKSLPNVVFDGAGGRLLVRHGDRIARSLNARLRVATSFTLSVDGLYLKDAIESAACYGAAVRLGLNGDPIAPVAYVGSQDFHSIVMGLTAAEDVEDDDGAGASDTRMAA